MRDRLLDIGCGTGQTTRDAADVAMDGHAIGVDTSREMLEIARRRANDAGLRNVTFEQGDAQYHAFPAASFDLCISRFGTMFFADPAAAFANIARAMRPGGRLVWMVWQSQERNEWSEAIRRAMAPLIATSQNAPAAFSMSDPTVATEVLRGAGFRSIDFADVRESVFYGVDVGVAAKALVDLYLANLNEAHTAGQRDKVLNQLHDLLEAHVTPEGILFDSRAWIITARRL
ncbi:methyltransferase domain-containing protein [Agrobacterium tumefaciens]|nr:methyltransferase domain-containing protein [Agrobacterium tumefaciens]NTA35522.1 methyltransferase domain-containing protein [Agrobacterium salinitolerans]